MAIFGSSEIKPVTSSPRQLVESHVRTRIRAAAADGRLSNLYSLGFPHVLEVDVTEIIFESTSIEVDLSNPDEFDEKVVEESRSTYPNCSDTEYKVDYVILKSERFTFASTLVNFVEQTHNETSTISVDVKAGANAKIFSASAGVNFQNVIAETIRKSITETKQSTIEKNKSTTEKKDFTVPAWEAWSFFQKQRIVTGIAKQNARFVFNAKGRVRLKTAGFGTTEFWQEFDYSRIDPDAFNRTVEYSGPMECKVVVEDIIGKEQLDISKYCDNLPNKME